MSNPATSQAMSALLPPVLLPGRNRINNYYCIKVSRTNPCPVQINNATYCRCNFDWIGDFRRDIHHSMFTHSAHKP